MTDENRAPWSNMAQSMRWRRVEDTAREATSALSEAIDGARGRPGDEDNDVEA